MSVFRYTGSKVGTMDFVFHLQRIREGKCTCSQTLARKIEAKRRRELEEGTTGIKKSARPKMFAFAAEDWLELKKGTLAPSSIGPRGQIRHLRGEDMTTASLLKRIDRDWHEFEWRLV